MCAEAHCVMYRMQRTRRDPLRCPADDLMIPGAAGASIPRIGPRRVAAPASPKNENKCRDHKFITNRVAERPTATTSATVHALLVCNAYDLSLKTPEAPETRLDQPLITRAAHAL